ncbi:lysophospholipid acyltransferase family protein [Kribbella sp. CA-293567]|uniref:lysophospholipid acyltransferase family protein n=1 Tax=Kribbella sp. CA-293567 TaxID=3002436 RepID=UPI0022DE7BCE|nr:1-acyl-sn-glycerol-3-phosphate acyltransferase [Kribbella sp. CA-293567]WBQ06168.1 1-acyl-sn-glycerol-3-phosphate acyltransferase [Kribbella sp. CA-293567]
MADADIIPIGSGGRPGRGSGRRTTPSAAARALAGPEAAKERAERTERARAAQARAAETDRSSAADQNGAAAGEGGAARKGRAGKTRVAAVDQPARSSEAASNSPLSDVSAPATDASAGPVSAGRASARPVSAGPASAGRASAGPVSAGPASAGRASAGPVSAGPASAGTAGPTFDGPSGVEVGDNAALRDFAAFEKLVRETLGVDGERKVAEFLAFLRRRLTGEYEVDEFGYDSDLTDQVLLTGLRPLAEKWFRAEVRGIENIPDTGSALIVANHSGTMPIDGLITQLVIADHTNRPLRTLAADLVFKTPFVGELARKGGATLASNDDAERLLRQGNLVGVWPEGFKGLGKPFSERYKLQRFGRGGFVSAAMRTGVPIVPCSIVGAEEIYPLVGNLASLARLVGVPYIPVTPFFPLLGPLGMIPLPSKWLIEFGEPIRTDDFPDGAADDPMLVFNVTDQVRETIQQTLYTLLMQRRSVFF